MALVWLWCGFEVALYSQVYGFEVALMTHWGGFGFPIGCLPLAYQMALGWL
jgi:hypothetical protein